MPGPHYALSELLLFAFSIYAVFFFFKNRNFFAFCGIIVVGITAIIASWRFGLNQIAELKNLHQIFTQLSFLFAIPLISTEIILKSGRIANGTNALEFKVGFLASMLLSLLAFFNLLYPFSTLFILNPSFIAFTFLIAGLIFSFLIPRDRLTYNIISGLVFSIILINILANQFRIIDDDSIRFHVYHIVLAIWVYLLTKLINKKRS